MKRKDLCSWQAWIGVGLGGCAQLEQKVMGIKYTGVGFGNGKYCGNLKSFLCVLGQMSTYQVFTLQTEASSLWIWDRKV